MLLLYLSHSSAVKANLVRYVFTVDGSLDDCTRRDGIGRRRLWEETFEGI